MCSSQRAIHNSEFEIAPATSPFFQRPLRTGGLFGIDLSQSQVNLLACAKLSREPIFKVCFQCLKVDAEAHFDQAIRYGETFIESRASRKTPHEEAIQPDNGAGPRPMGTQELYLDFTREHKKRSIVSSERSDFSYQPLKKRG